MPFFSIIIPCFNQSGWLKQCIQSIQEQEFQNWEAIIINDGSVDDTPVVADQLAANDSRIKVIHQANAGLSAARNAGLAIADGNWLNFLDSDDYYFPGCLKMVSEQIVNHSEYCIAQTGYRIVDDNRAVISSKKLFSKSGYFLNEVFNGNIGPPLSIFIHKKFSKKIGLFDITLKSAEDWDYWIRASKAGAQRLVIPEPLVAYRHTSGSMSRNAWRMYENTNTVIGRIGKKDNRITEESALNKDVELDLTPAIKLRLIQCLGLAVMQRKVEESLQMFRSESIKYNFTYTPKDFSSMNSFLSFRNWYRPEDIKKVMKFYPRNFRVFFSQTGFTESFQKAAFDYVFEYHRQNFNLLKYGVLGKLINKFYQVKKMFSTKGIQKGYTVSSKNG